MPVTTTYARGGGVHIAYQVAGGGPADLVLVPGSVWNVELLRRLPSGARLLEGITTIGRLVAFDTRGTGGSDRVPEGQLPTLEGQVDDLLLVMDAAGSARAVVVGLGAGAAPAALFAATRPERTAALVLYGAAPRASRTQGFPWAPRPEARAAFLERLGGEWAAEDTPALRELAPTLARDPAAAAWWRLYLRRSASRGAALALARIHTATDVRSVLPAIGVPTLLVHRVRDRHASVRGARWMAGAVPGAELVELPGEDHLPFAGDVDALVRAIGGFVANLRPLPGPARVFGTVLASRVAGSGTQAVRMGDHRWMDALEAHRTIARWHLERFRGHEVPAGASEFHATFDGPVRALRCALGIREAARQRGVEVRTGLHAGALPVEGARGTQVLEIAAAASIAARAGDVLATREVTDLAAGAGLGFADRGELPLDGRAPGHRIAAVEPEAPPAG